MLPFRGTTLEQDARWENKNDKLKKNSKFPKEYAQKVDMSKVSVDVLKPWISYRLTELLGIEDDVVVSLAVNLLDTSATGKPLDARDVQINLTGFLGIVDAKTFVTELWRLLISASKSKGGIPEDLLRKYEENRRTRVRAAIEAQEARRPPAQLPTPPRMKATKNSPKQLLRSKSASRPPTRFRSPISRRRSRSRDYNSSGNSSVASARSRSRLRRSPSHTRHYRPTHKRSRSHTHRSSSPRRSRSRSRASRSSRAHKRSHHTHRSPRRSSRSRGRGSRSPSRRSRDSRRRRHSHHRASRRRRSRSKSSHRSQRSHRHHHHHDDDEDSDDDDDGENKRLHRNGKNPIRRSNSHHNDDDDDDENKRLHRNGKNPIRRSNSHHNDDDDDDEDKFLLRARNIKDSDGSSDESCKERRRRRRGEQTSEAGLKLTSDEHDDFGLSEADLREKALRSVVVNKTKLKKEAQRSDVNKLNDV